MSLYTKVVLSSTGGDVNICMSVPLPCQSTVALTLVLLDDALNVIFKIVIITFAGTATTPAVFPEDRTDPVPVVPPKSTFAVAALLALIAKFRKTSLPQETFLLPDKLPLLAIKSWDF